MRFITIGALGATLALGGASLAAGCTVTTTQTDFGSDGGTGGSDARSDGHTGTGTGTGTGGGGGSGQCADLCARSATANCSSQSTCESDCETQSAKSPSACSDAYDALLTCASTKATFSSCDSKGKPVMTGCDQETTDYVSCLTSGGGGGGGTDGGGGGGGTCGGLSTGNASCDTCMQGSCCTDLSTCAGNSACVAILDCFTQQNCTTDQCYTQCESQHSAGTADEQAIFSCMQSGCTAACQ